MNPPRGRVSAVSAETVEKGVGADGDARATAGDEGRPRVTRWSGTQPTSLAGTLWHTCAGSGVHRTLGTKCLVIGSRQSLGHLTRDVGAPGSVVTWVGGSWGSVPARSQGLVTPPRPAVHPRLSCWTSPARVWLLRLTRDPLVPQASARLLSHVSIPRMSGYHALCVCACLFSPCLLIVFPFAASCRFCTESR